MGMSDPIVHRAVFCPIFARYLKLEAERVQIVDGALDLEAAIDRYNQIWAEQAQMREEMGPQAWAELQDWI
jgi:hypothetical protein